MLYEGKNPRLKVGDNTNIATIKYYVSDNIINYF